MSVTDIIVFAIARAVRILRDFAFVLTIYDVVVSDVRILDLILNGLVLNSTFICSFVSP